MRLVFPDAVTRLTQAFKNDRGELSAHKPLCVLMAWPELARDPAVYPFVFQHLMSKAAGYRLYAAVILHDIGDPLGILHLTYNALSVHPILKHDQRYWETRATARTRLLRRAHSLTQECIDLLIQEMRTPAGNLQVDALAAAPAEIIVPRLLPLLAGSQRTAVQAAYVLACKGREEARSVLQHMLESMHHVELALIALSHIPDQKAISLLRAYLDAGHPIHNRIGEFTSKELTDKIAQRLPLMEDPSDATFTEVMKRYYLKPAGSIPEIAQAGLPEGINPELFVFQVINPAHYPTTKDFIAELGTAAARSQLVDIQMRGIHDLLKVDSSGEILAPVCHFGFEFYRADAVRRPANTLMFLKGFEISYEPSDYVFDATDWILNAERYRNRSPGMTIAHLMGEDLF